jgi:hypothetical protein
MLNHDWGAGSRLVNSQILTSPSADARTADYNLQTARRLIMTPLQIRRPSRRLSASRRTSIMMLSFRYTFQQEV